LPALESLVPTLESFLRLRPVLSGFRATTAEAPRAFVVAADFRFFRRRVAGFFKAFAGNTVGATASALRERRVRTGLSAEVSAESVPLVRDDLPLAALTPAALPRVRFGAAGAFTRPDGAGSAIGVPVVERFVVAVTALDEDFLVMPAAADFDREAGSGAATARDCFTAFGSGEGFGAGAAETASFFDRTLIARGATSAFELSLSFGLSLS
jgi:hypothetical protein